MALFNGWYTDTVDIYRVTSTTQNSITYMSRSLIASGVKCRVYNTQKNGPNMADTAAKMQSTDKLACDISVDIQAGDELMVTRGGALGKTSAAERYFAGDPQAYYDPVGRFKTGLEHQEVGLLKSNIIAQEAQV